MERAVKRDLKEVRKRSRTAAASGLAATAVALGAALDDPDTTATARAACAKELRETMRVLRQQLEAEPAQVDAVADLRSRRESRKATT